MSVSICLLYSIPNLITLFNNKGPELLILLCSGIGFGATIFGYRTMYPFLLNIICI